MKAPIVYMEKMATLYVPQDMANAMIDQEEKDTKRQYAIHGALRGAGRGALGGGAFGTLVGGMASKGTGRGFARGAMAGAVVGALAHAAAGAYKGYGRAKKLFDPGDKWHQPIKNPEQHTMWDNNYYGREFPKNMVPVAHNGFGDT